MNTCENLRLILWVEARAHHPFHACCSFSFHPLLVLPVQPEESLTQVLSSVRSRSRREAAERTNDRRRAHNVSIDGLNQAIIGQSILLEMVSAERVEPDAPRHKWAGVLPSSSPLARLPSGETSRGSLSRSVSLRRGCFPVPQGTSSCLCQDIECCIVISLQDHTTAWTDVAAHTQRLLHQCSTCATFLAGELRCDCNE